MAFSSKQTSGRIRRRRYRPLSEINVTPFVDVMLVLLVVFMVTAPLLTIGIPLDLPKSDQTSADDSLVLNDTVEAVTITIDADGTLFLGEDPTEFDTLVNEVLAQTGDNQDVDIHVRGAQGADYGLVWKVMNDLHVAGYSRLSLLGRHASDAR